jgi:hypothetical protein
MFYLIVSGAVLSLLSLKKLQTKFVQVYTSELIITFLWSFPEYDNNQRAGISFFYYNTNISDIAKISIYYVQ